MMPYACERTSSNTSLTFQPEKGGWDQERWLVPTLPGSGFPLQPCFSRQKATPPSPSFTAAGALAGCCSIVTCRDEDGPAICMSAKRLRRRYVITPEKYFIWGYYGMIEKDSILLLGYSILYKEDNLTGFNHQKNTQVRAQEVQYVAWFSLGSG